jgi:hypothetical protein
MQVCRSCDPAPPLQPITNLDMDVLHEFSIVWSESA